MTYEFEVGVWAYECQDPECGHKSNTAELDEATGIIHCEGCGGVNVEEG